MFDVRSVANLTLDRADSRGRGLSNLQLNKIVYFVHAEHLVCFGSPLVRAKIEAWKFGPVFRELYHEFKVFSDRPITNRATRVDFETGERVIVREEVDKNLEGKLYGWIDFYSEMPAQLLVNLSHVPGGPWDQVWNHGGNLNPGMEITSPLIVKHHRAMATS